MQARPKLIPINERQELQVTRNQLDEFWSTRRKAQEAFLAQKKAEQDVSRRESTIDWQWSTCLTNSAGSRQTYRQKTEVELRERYLSETMEAYADELDALRKDPGFRGR